ncbi:MAG: DNA starvation/stationary phase protection protein Dps [Euryarchaeota archaeon]|nr:DNA starvation/stationary phase protection protein Dps [Euryarchaeota archaeon]
MASNTFSTTRAPNGSKHAASGREFPTRIALPLQARKPLQALLNACLADALDLYSQTKQAHWNVKGPNFYQLHLLFDELAERVEGHVDLFAERVRSLGGNALGTVRMAATGSSLPEFPGSLTTDLAFVEALAERYATYGAHLRAAIAESAGLEDQGTADIFTEASRAADRGLYFLEAHLQGRPLP